MKKIEKIIFIVLYMFEKNWENRKNIYPTSMIRLYIIVWYEKSYVRIGVENLLFIQK